MSYRSRFLSSVLIVLAVGSLEAETYTVNVGPGTFFNPPGLNIAPGDTVVWHFVEFGHTTTSDAISGPEVWDSGFISSGEDFSHTFSTVGEYPYHCTPHGTLMTGLVSVIAPPSRHIRGDFDGDGTSDLNIFRPSTSTWWSQLS